MTKDSNNKSRSAGHVSYVPGIVLGASQMFRDPYFTEEEVGTGWLSGSQDVRQGSRSVPSSQPLTTMMVRKDEPDRQSVVCPALLLVEGGRWHQEPDGAGMAQGESTGATGQWDKRLVRVRSRCPWSGYCKGGG